LERQDSDKPGPDKSEDYTGDAKENERLEIDFSPKNSDFEEIVEQMEAGNEKNSHLQIKKTDSHGNEESRAAESR
jgi:hypothetical protein